MVNKIIQNGSIQANEWIIVSSDHVNEMPDGKVILPLKLWQEHFQSISLREPTPGLWLNSDERPADFPGDLNILPIIAVYFPAFTDGRGFSLGNLLRDRLGYRGELRACGHFIRDQLFYLKRCGFNAFEFDNPVNLEEAIKSLQDFSETYQVAADQGEPLFRRRS